MLHCYYYYYNTHTLREDQKTSKPGHRSGQDLYPTTACLILALNT